MTFGEWNESLHHEPDQQKRIITAKKSATTPTQIDKDAQTALFAGSGKSPYETTLNTCTCRDYFVRRMPCKHIYRLAIELGILNEEAATGENKNADFEMKNQLLNTLFSMPTKSQELLYHICEHDHVYSDNTRSISVIERNDFATVLLHYGYCIETVFEYPLLRVLDADKLSMIISHCSTSAVDFKDKKRKELVAMIESQKEVSPSDIQSKIMFLELSETAATLKNTIKRRYEKCFVKIQVESEPGSLMYYEDVKQVFIQE